MTTSQKQTSLFTEEQLTCLRVDFHVNHTAQREKDSGKRTNAIYGPKCLEQFGRFNRPGLWAKTFAGLLLGMEGWYSTRCKLIWKLKATKYSRFYFQLQGLTLPTKDIECGLLPTPTSSLGGDNFNSPAVTQRGHGKNLTGVAKNLLLPTPQAIDGTGTGRELRLKKDCNRDPNQPGSWRGDLKDYAFMEMLPTPRAGDGMIHQLKQSPDGSNQGRLEYAIANKLLPTPMASDCGEKVTGLENQDSLTKMAREITGETSQLNHRFVAEMMGFPPNWCDSAYEKIVWDYYLKKKSTKSFQKRIQNLKMKP